MKGAYKLLLLSLLALIAALAIDHLFVPPTTPIGWTNDPQPVWQVEVSFLLRAIENIAATIVAIVLVAAGVFHIRRWFRPNLQP